MFFLSTGFRRHALPWLPILVLCGTVLPAGAQTPRMVSPDRVPVGHDVVWYWEPSTPSAFDGAQLALPVSWSPVRASVVDRDGAVHAVDIRRDGRLAGRYRLDVPTPVAALRQLRVQVRVGDAPMEGRFSLVPLDRVVSRGAVRLVPREADRMAGSLRVEERPGIGSNRGLRLAEGRPPLPLDGRRIPDLGASAAWTVETWFRTIALDVVMLSTWDGSERSDYPAELVIDPEGRLRFYQGESGRHRSLRSADPVADGGWHHVAVTHDPERGWTRLLVDGTPVDSLYGFDMLRARKPERLVLGGRTVDSGPDDATRYRGYLDEVRIWSVARTTRTIRAGMYRALPQPAAGAVVLAFDTPVDRRLLADGRMPHDPVPVDLRFREPIRDLTVRPGTGQVTLSWSGDPSGETRYVVERSPDGSTFEAVATYRIAQAAVDPLSGLAVFHHTDRVPDGRVAYYRVRQRDAVGADRVTAPIKVGVGGAAASLRVELAGAYPNPFNPTTTVTYHVREGSDVTVSVWDLSGQRIRVLRDAYHEPGTYSVPFTADELPSGTYFVRLQTAEGVQSHQIVLAK